MASVSVIESYNALLQIEIESGSSTDSFIRTSKEYVRHCQCLIDHQLKSSPTDITTITASDLRLLIEIPKDVVRWISSSPVTHDCIEDSFEKSIVLTKLLNIWSWNNTDTIPRHVEWLRVILSVLDNCRFDTVFEVKKIEALLEMANILFTMGIDDGVIIEAESKDVIDSFIQPIMTGVPVLLSRMKAIVTSDRELLSHIRSSFSDIKKQSIALIDNVLTLCPHWIVYNKDEYWALCMKMLVTPLLFHHCYRANESVMVENVVSHLYIGILQCDQYSYATAKDIVGAIDNLIKLKCINVLTSTSSSQNLLAVLITAICKIPKVTKRALIMNWKLLVTNTIQDMIGLSVNLSNYNTFDCVCNSLFLRNLLSEEMCTLYNLLGYDCTENIIKISDRKKMSIEMYGVYNIEKMMDALHAYTVVVAGHFDILLYKDISAATTVVPSKYNEEDTALIVNFIVFMSKCVSRKVIFADDHMQMCSEVDLLVKMVTYIWRHEEDISGCRQLVLDASLSICTVIEKEQNDGIFYSYYIDSIIYLMNEVLGPCEAFSIIDELRGSISTISDSNNESSSTCRNSNHFSMYSNAVKALFTDKCATN